MIYSNFVNEVVIFVYELGYVFYSSMMWDLFFLNCEYVMNVVEIVSIFVELIVVDVILKVVKIKEEKINLLDIKL